MRTMLYARPWSPRRAAVLVVLLALLAHGVTLGGDFVFDDSEAVVDNPVVAGRVPLLEAFTRDFWGRRAEGGSVGTYRPLVVLSFALDRALGGGAPFLFHLQNLLWHCAASLLVLAFGLSVTTPAVAAAGAALFAVFAPSGEAVQSIVGRADVMFVAFGLLATLAHRSARRGAGLVAAVSFGFALFCKETAIVLPVAWLLLDRARPTGVRTRARWAAYTLVLLLALGVRAGFYSATLAPGVDPLRNPLVEAPLPHRVGGAAATINRQYVPGLLDPSRRLYTCTPATCVPESPAGLAALAGLAVVLAVLAVLVFAAFRAGSGARVPTAVIGLGWAALFFAPVSNLLVLGPTIYAERLLYAPAVGLCLAVAAVASALARKLDRPAIAWTLFATLVLAHATSTLVRGREWWTGADLYPTALAHAPDSWQVLTNAAHAAYSRADPVTAKELSARALAIVPEDVPARALHASALARLGEVDAAVREFEALMRRSPGPDATADFVRLLVRLGRRDEALGVWSQAVRQYPGSSALRGLEPLVRGG